MHKCDPKKNKKNESGKKQNVLAIVLNITYLYDKVLQRNFAGEQLVRQEYAGGFNPCIMIAGNIWILGRLLFLQI